jgi:hypothetical protein
MTWGAVRRVTAALALLACGGAAPPPSSAFIEPAEPLVPSVYDAQTIERIETARAQGLASDELWFTLEAVAKAPTHFELWDNAAALSCRVARTLARSSSVEARHAANRRREMGLALVGEFRCAVAVAHGELSCFCVSAIRI